MDFMLAIASSIGRSFNFCAIGKWLGEGFDARKTTLAIIVSQSSWDRDYRRSIVVLADVADVVHPQALRASVKKTVTRIVRFRLQECKHAFADSSKAALQIFV